jgi:large repetitive protein
MRTTHKQNLTYARILLVSCVAFVLSGIGTAYLLPQVAAHIGAVRANNNRQVVSGAAVSASRRDIAAGALVATTGSSGKLLAGAASRSAVAFDQDELATFTLTSNPPSGSNVVTGGLIAFTASINNTTDTETTPVITMNVPAGTTFFGVSTGGTDPFTCTPPAPGTPGPVSFNCTEADLGIGQTSSVQMIVQVVAAPGATIGPVTATYDDADSVATQSAPGLTFTVIGGGSPADLIADKYQYNQGAGAGQVLAGGGANANLITAGPGEIVYQLDAANTGPNDAFNVYLLDNIPANVEYVPGSLNFTALPATTAGRPQWTCDGDPWTGGIQPPTPGLQLQCRPNDNGTVGRFNAHPSEVVRITYKVRVPAGVAPGTIIANGALLISTVGGGGSNSDPNAANNLSPALQTQVNTQADLALDKTTSNPTPVAGGAAFSYTITVTNPGPSTARDVVVTDPLPPGVLLVNGNIAVGGTAGAGFSCAGPAIGTNGTITCTNANMPVGTATLTATVQITPDVASGVRLNQATVASSTPDPSLANNSNVATSAQIDIVNNATLLISKTAPAIASAGDTITYNINVLNTGNSSALNVVVTDVLPANTSFVSVTGAGAFNGGCNYNQATNTVTCNAGVLPAGQHVITLLVKTASSTPVGPLNNQATLAAGVGLISGTNPASASTNINHRADLQITKNDSPDAVLPGGQITYTVAVQNLGPSDAAAGEVEVSENVFPPTGTTLQGVITSPGFNCVQNVAAPQLVCTSNAALPAGATGTVQYTVVVDANFNGGAPGGAVANTAIVAAVGANIGDPNANNNQASTSTPVGPNADLQLNKTAETALGAVVNSPVRAGGSFDPVAAIGGLTGTIEYVLSYRNNGPGTAVNPVISDVIPANTLFVIGSLNVNAVAGAAPVCAFAPNPAGGNQIRCTVAALNLGDNGTITFRVRVPADVTKGTVIKNQAVITADTPDPNTSSNTSNETQNVVDTAADLSITKTDAPDPVVAGNNVTYTLTVTNNATVDSGSDAANVTVTDTLPSQVNFVSANSSDPNFNCNHSGGVVTCTAPKLAVGATATITIVAQVKANTPNGTNLSNTATASATTFDPDQTNNTATATTAVVTEANVTIEKVDNPDPVVAGTNLNYRVTVRNTGPSDAQAVSIVDTLPAGTSFVSFSGTGILANAGVCSHAAGVVTCAQGNPSTMVLPAGVTWQLDIVVKVNANVPANPLPHTPDNANGLLNTAVVNWSDSNGVVGALVAQNATATTRTTIRHESDMSIKKEAPDFVTAGTRMDYRLIFSNKGPSDVLGDAGLPGSIVVWDLLPVGTSLANVANNPFIAPGGPGGFVCRSVTGQGPANNQTLVLCYNAADAAGNFPVGANLEIIIKVDTASNIANGTNLNNCAQVTLRNTDATPEIDPIGGGQHDNTNPAVALPVVNPGASGNNEACDATVVQTSADLGISKTATASETAPGQPNVPLPVVGPNVPPGSVNAGGYIRFDVPFGNAGPSDALNVRITDVVPGNTAFVANTVNGNTTFTITANTVPATTPINITCTVSGLAGSQQITCTPADNTGVNATYVAGVLPAGYQGTLTYYVKVNESVSGGTIVANAANITSAPSGTTPGTADPNPGNNTSLPTQTVVISTANLTISKIVQSAVTAASNPNQTGPIGPATVPNGAGLTGTAVLPGTYLTYRVTITNNGPSDVSNIRLTDVLPSGLETPPGRVLGVKYVSVTPVLPSGATFVCAPPTGVNPNSNPQGNGGSLVCTAPLLSANAPNNVAAIDITVFIDPATKASLVNTATVDATLNNFNRPVSGTTTLTTPVAPTSDLALTKTHTNTSADGQSVVAGSSFQYTITLTNNGPSAAQMAELVDTLPAFQKVTAIQVQQTPDGNGAPNMTCNATPAVGQAGNTTSVTCTAAELPPNKKPDGTVNPSGTLKVILTVTQDPLTPQPTPTQYQNCVTATSMSTDPNPANNTNICDTVTVSFFSPLTATKTDSPDPIVAGNLLTYVIKGSPNGPSAALNFTISDPLPQGTVFISAAASAGATLTTPAVNANGTVTAIWNAAGGTTIGLTPVGVERSLTIVVRVCSDFQQIRNLTDAGMCVPNLTNTANVYSETPPNLVGNPVTASTTTTVQAQSNLAIAKSGPVSAYPSSPNVPSIVTYTLTVTNNTLSANQNSSNASGVVVTDVLPRGFEYVANSVNIAAGAGGGDVAAPNASVNTDATGQQTVTINLGVVGTTVANGGSDQCGNPGGPIVTPRAAVVVITLRARVPNKHPNITVTNVATVTSSNCLAETGTLPVQANPLSGFAAIITPGSGLLANNRAFWDTIIGPPPTDPGPGSVPGYVATAEVSDQKAGSVLFYPIYTSDAANPNTQNTRISITNISGAEQAAVHLFVVDGSSCAVLDAFICLTPNQTTTFLASDFDPGATGYIVAVAVDRNTGLPIAFNCLIGDEYVKFTTGHQANLGAEAIAAVNMFPAGTDQTATTATLRFDGISYNALPRILALDSIGSRADQNDTLMIVNAVGGNFTRSGATIVSLFGNLYDDAETSYSFSQNVSTCQYRTVLSNNFPRILNQFTNIIPAGRTGWMKFWSTADIGLFGAAINRNPNAAANSGAFNQGHNLHKLTLTRATTITVPVLTPACL